MQFKSIILTFFAAAALVQALPTEYDKVARELDTGDVVKRAEDLTECTNKCVIGCSTLPNFTTSTCEFICTFQCIFN